MQNQNVDIRYICTPHLYIGTEKIRYSWLNMVDSLLQIYRFLITRSLKLGVCMGGWMDGQPQNIMPLATSLGRHNKRIYNRKGFNITIENLSNLLKNTLLWKVLKKLNALLKYVKMFQYIYIYINCNKQSYKHIEVY